MCPHSLFDLIPKNTSTSLSPLPTVVVAPVVSSANVPLLLPNARRAETTRKRSKLANTYHTHRHTRFISCSLLLYEHAKVVRLRHISPSWPDNPQVSQTRCVLIFRDYRQGEGPREAWGGPAISPFRRGDSGPLLDRMVCRRDPPPTSGLKMRLRRRESLSIRASG